MSQKTFNLHKHPLYGYLPDYAIQYVDSLVKDLHVHFKVVSPRKTKLGDCRYPLRGRKEIIITVNQDLKPIQFLVTSLHELAHAKTYISYGIGVQPHGEEWKNIFSEILREIMTSNSIPDEHRVVLNSISQNPKATSFGNIALQRLSKDENIQFLRDLDNGSHFEFNSRKFIKEKLLRTYVLCTCLKTSKRYKVHGLAEVSSLE